MVSEGRDKKGGFTETKSSKYPISQSKMQGIFEPGFDSDRIKQQNKTQDRLNNLSTSKIGR